MEDKKYCYLFTNSRSELIAFRANNSGANIGIFVARSKDHLTFIFNSFWDQKARQKNRFQHLKLHTKYL